MTARHRRGRGLLHAIATLFGLAVGSLLLGGLVSRAPHRTLVLYAFSDTDPDYQGNLRYFVRHGVAGAAADFVLVVNGATSFELPSLPRHARYLRRENACYDWGSYGVALNELGAWRGKYAYYVFVNSSVRGPFCGPADGGGPCSRARSWVDALTRRLSDRIKLVGPTISCEHAPADGATEMPHVQSYVLATDATGLAVLRAAGVFECRDTLRDVIVHSEVGASKAVLAAGFGLDCLMPEYRGVDWTDRATWNCSGGHNPYLTKRLVAQDLMFIKMQTPKAGPCGGATIAGCQPRSPAARGRRINTLARPDKI